MNCLLLEYGDDIVLLDCGVQFPDASYPGVDLLLPDLTYVYERIDKVRAVVVTHGHDDHIGAIPFLARHKELDVYSTPFPRGLVEQKLIEFQGTKEIHWHTIVPRQQFEVGPFRFDPIPVQHSIIEALAFAIETPVGTLIHSGDFKHDPLETSQGVIGFEPFEEWGKKGVHLLLSDSTNAERCGHTPSEVEIAESFEKILSEHKGRILVALFASNIKRIEKLLALCHRLGKKVAFAGRSMHSYTRLAHEQGKLTIPEDTLILLENTQTFSDDQIVVLATGSQAEPQSALLRISQGIHKDFQIRNNDLVILSSRFIPGNEKAISAMIDHLYREGAEVMYEAVQKIHVSGHGFQEELLMLLRATKPKFFVPIHGAFRHLSKHAKLAREAGVAAENIHVIEDGQMLEVTPQSITRTERLNLQKAAVIGGIFMQSSPEVFTQRNNLSKTGIVFVVLLRESGSRLLVEAPSIHSYGLLFRKGEKPEEVLLDARDHLEDVYAEAASRPDLEELIRLEMRRFFRKRVSLKPVVIPLVLDV